MFSWWNHLLSINGYSAGVWRAFSICILLLHASESILEFLHNKNTQQSFSKVDKSTYEPITLLDCCIDCDWLVIDLTYFAFTLTAIKKWLENYPSKCIFFAVSAIYNIFVLLGPNHNLDLLLMRIYCKLFDVRATIFCSNTMP